MSLMRATCPVHGPVKVHKEGLRHTCGRVCEPIPDVEPDYLRNGNGTLAYDSDAPKDDQAPVADAPPVEPDAEPEQSTADRFREYNDAHEIGRLTLPPGRAGQMFLTTSRALLEQMETEIAGLETRIKQDTAQLELLRDAAWPIRHLLKRYDESGVKIQPTAAQIWTERRTAHTPGVMPSRMHEEGKPWSRDYTACRKCGRSTIKHAAHGFCYGCRPSGNAAKVAIWEAQFEADEAAKKLLDERVLPERVALADLASEFDVPSPVQARVGMRPAMKLRPPRG